MKRYIRTSTTTDNVFDTTTTHMSYYDRFLDAKELKYMQEAKNLDGKIVYMTPDEYFKGAAKIFDYKYTPKQLEDQRSDSLLPEYVEAMKNGAKFPLCFLNYADSGQEGLHRMLAAKKAFGPNVKYPVLVVTPYDQELWEEQKLIQEINNFERYEFSDLIEDMERDLGDWSERPPADLAEKAEEYIQRRATNRGYDITVDCEVKDYQGDLRLDVVLISYNGYDIDYVEPSNKSPWLGNMFDMDESTNDEDIDPLLEGLDDSDLEIEDFFFK